MLTLTTVYSPRSDTTFDSYLIAAMAAIGLRVSWTTDHRKWTDCQSDPVLLAAVHAARDKRHADFQAAATARFGL